MNEYEQRAGITGLNIAYFPHENGGTEISLDYEVGLPALEIEPAQAESSKLAVIISE